MALDRWVEVKDPLNPALHLPAAFDSEQAVRQRVDELIELLSLEAFRTKFVHELSTGSRTGGRPGLRGRPPPQRGAARRAVERHRPARGRGARPAAAAPARRAGRAACSSSSTTCPWSPAVADRLVALDQGLLIADGPPDEVLHDPVVVSSYLGDTAAAIARSGRHGPDPTVPLPDWRVGPTHSTDCIRTARPTWRNRPCNPPPPPPSRRVPATLRTADRHRRRARGGGRRRGGHAWQQRLDSDRRPATTTAPGGFHPRGRCPGPRPRRRGKTKSIDWGSRCDTTTGKLKYPYYFAGECYAPFKGDNGGATYQGVTSRSIKVVLYLAEANDPILNYIEGSIADTDTNEQTIETVQG